MLYCNSANGLLIKIDDKQDLNLIRNRISGYNTPRMSKDKRFGVASVVNLERFQPSIESNIDGSNIKIRLADNLNAELNKMTKNAFERDCREHGIEPFALDYAENLILYRVQNASRAAIDAIATMDGVISVKRMPYLEITASPEPYNTKLDVLSPIQGESYPRAGLLDSGVECIPHLNDWLLDEENLAGLNENEIDKGHGTAVAGILLYGDKLENEDYTGCQPMFLKSCIVNTKPRNAQIQEWELVMYIKEAIRNNPDIKVWNLSQGSNIEVDDSKFSDFAIALDSIQKECNVLICKSAGNIDMTHPEKARITEGAESIRSLVVGSISHAKLADDEGEINHRSPFSRIGYGPENLVKPDLVHYGGNLKTGVQSFSFTGYQTNARISGTSFSTPRVTALAATLAHHINREFDPTLIKALLIHNATYPKLYCSNEQMLKEEGYGLPQCINNIIHNDENEFTMVWEETIEKGNDLVIRDIPFPRSLVDEDGFYYGDITVTLVTDPILKESEGYEYCQSNVDVLLETYNGTEYYVLGAAGTPSTYRNSDRLIDSINPNRSLRWSFSWLSL